MPRLPGFYIVGTGRSGTTLLQAMLMSHPRLHIPPETQFFSRFDPALHGGDPLPPDAEDRYIAALANDPWFRELGLSRERLSNAVRAGARSARDLLAWFVGELCNGNTKPTIGEKTPHHDKYLDRILAVTPDAKIIHIHRDPRDVVASLWQEKWWNNRSALLTARHCRRIYDRLHVYESRLGTERFLRLRYETLVEHPEPELRRLCSFLGEAFDPAMLRYHERGDSGFTSAESAWKGLTMRPLDPSRHGRYRNKLTPHQIRTIERVIGEAHLHEMGYDIERELPRRTTWVIADAMELARWRMRRYAGSVSKRVGRSSPTTSR